MNANNARVERPTSVIENPMEGASSPAPALAHRLLAENYGDVHHASDEVEGQTNNEGGFSTKTNTPPLSIPTGMGEDSSLACASMPTLELTTHHHKESSTITQHIIAHARAQ